MAARPEVVIAGAGPVGLTLAARLVDAGVRTLVLEAAPRLPKELRASTFHPSTLDLLARIGDGTIVERLTARGLVTPSFQYRHLRTGAVARFELGRLAPETAHPHRLQAEQYKLCEVLLDDLAGRATFEIRFGARAVDVEPDDDGVGVVVETADGATTRVEASWLVGADGSTSRVRRALRIGFPGLTYEDRYLVLSTSHDVGADIDGLSGVNYLTGPEEWYVLLRTVELWRALFPIGSDESDEAALSDASARARLGRVAPGGERWPVDHRTVYRVHQRVADTFRTGRVLLVGDAAHINNPLGGMGMNGGIHDAYLFGRGLVQVLRDGADDELLDRYAAVRRKLAIEYVQRHTHATATGLASPDGAVRETAFAAMAAKADDPDASLEYLRQASMLTAVRQMWAALGEED